MTLTEQVRSGKRKVVVSTYHLTQELEYGEYDWAGAVEELRRNRRLVNGHGCRLPDWQWQEAGVTKQDVEELEAALWVDAQ